MRLCVISFAFVLLLGCSSRHAIQFEAPDRSTAEENVQAVFSDLRMLEPMKDGRQYTVMVAGKAETGSKEKFLRRRNAAEIRGSNLLSGCGDYAIMFIDQIERRGFTSMLVDGAEISSGSLQSHFSGHAVVAIRGREASAEDPWWLVDSTNLEILSRSWAATNRQFEAFGSVFWIGYSGSLKDYPVHSPEDLKQFYGQTLARIPRDVMNRVVPRLKFTIDPSLRGTGDGFMNPRVPDLLRVQPSVLETYGIEPEREVQILLTSGGNNAISRLGFTDGVGWVCRLGLESACSPNLLSYFERTIRNAEQHRSE